ncbi:cytochrome P450 [Laetiporus sulphureus 93-53]|uniref:Cytochrome P450 n=1 Tax=Laetiporus sulphureus 93-53 TaxID=1314785 RepID=A0A165HWC6_9APHY|nr:cytochrome P450 [Laetiporus sulphureus 93-53]KZT12277.1 cytochrome P450 [Laetiporus sulphureus 93-53]
MVLWDCERMLYVADPKALHHILLKDEQIYPESNQTIVLNSLLLGPGLLSTLGELHKRQRRMLNPAFSVSHIRSMLPLFYEIVHKLRNAIKSEVVNGAKEVDILNWMGRVGLELIGQGGFGYSFDPLVADVQDDYGYALKSFSTHLQGISAWLRLLPYFVHIGPPCFRAWVTEIFPNPNVRGLKVVIDTMDRMSKEIYHAKQAAIQQGDEATIHQVGEGKDIMSILMKANMTAAENDKLPQSQLIAQMSTFTIAGMDTTSNALSRTLQSLAKHPHVQDKLREELLKSGAAEGIPYDDLNRLPLLDAVCRETLRLYPPATFVARAPVQGVVLPLSEPIVGNDGNTMSEVAIPKGTDLIISVLGCNANKALWGEDSFEWKPERWLSTLPKGVIEAGIPGAYSNLMTFMGGKRACIGFKFSEMEMKVVLAVLLSIFTFELTEKPIEWNVSGVSYPTVGKQSNKPSLPLRVRLFNDMAA